MISIPAETAIAHVGDAKLDVIELFRRAFALALAIATGSHRSHHALCSEACAPMQESGSAAKIKQRLSGSGDAGWHLRSQNECIANKPRHRVVGVHPSKSSLAGMSKLLFFSAAILTRDRR